MGNVSVVLQGINGNGTPQNIDEMAKAFVASLRAAGHINVEAVLVDGTSLVTDMVDKTMKRGSGYKMAEPLLPLCDHRMWFDSKSGTWSEQCRNLATKAQRDGVEIVSVRCDGHIPLTIPGDKPWVAICPTVVA